MMRKCHLNTCPVGVATQDPVLRKRFVGQPEHVINYFFFVAEEVRALMAALGYRKFDEMIGQRQMLDKAKLIEQAKAQRARLLQAVLQAGALADRRDPPRRRRRTTASSSVLDRDLHRADAGRAGARQARAARSRRSATRDRSAGAMLSGEIARRYGHAGLRDGAIHIKLKGAAGQSFGAFLAKGVTLELEGDGNDYVGKGLSGGRIVVYPPKRGDEDRRRSTRSSSATPCSMARSPASAISAASRASASACATPAPSRWSRARATTAANT